MCRRGNAQLLHIFLISLDIRFTLYYDKIVRKEKGDEFSN